MITIFRPTSCLAAALIGAFAAGVGQVVNLTDSASNAAGWGACLVAIAFFAVVGRPIRNAR